METYAVIDQPEMVLAIDFERVDARRLAVKAEYNNALALGYRSIAVLTEERNKLEADIKLLTDRDILADAYVKLSNAYNRMKFDLELVIDTERELHRDSFTKLEAENRKSRELLERAVEDLAREHWIRTRGNDPRPDYEGREALKDRGHSLCAACKVIADIERFLSPELLKVPPAEVDQMMGQVNVGSTT